MNLIKNPPLVIPQNWSSKSSFSRKQWLDWQADYKANLATELKMQISHSELKEKLYLNREILDLFKFKIGLLQGQLFYSHLFFLADSEGIILDIIGEESLHNGLRPLVVKLGSSMAMESGGVNAISIALETEGNIFLKGDEHQLVPFKEWLCLCCPIKVQGKSIAFLNFSRSTPFVYDSIFALVSSIVSYIEFELEKNLNDHNRVQALFNTYGFTNRECEVATLWLQNKGALYISEKLGITEGTVRNFVKKIYMKCSANDRGGFIQKFYQA